MEIKRLICRPYEISYGVSGRGSTVLLAHCSGSSHKQWRPLIEQLSPHHRVLAPDLLGYGGSTPWRKGMKLEPYTERDALLAVAACAPHPLHLVGHSYGAATILEVARALREKVLSITLFEPVTFHLLDKDTHPSAWQEAHGIATKVIDLVNQHRIQAAAEQFMAFWTGQEDWRQMPDHQKAYVRSSMIKIAQEFSLITSIDSKLEDNRVIKVPTLFLRGENTRQCTATITDLLLTAIEKADLETIPDAGHLAPITHGDEVNRHVLNHIAAHDPD